MGSEMCIRDRDQTYLTNIVSPFIIRKLMWISTGYNNAKMWEIFLKFKQKVVMVKLTKINWDQLLQISYLFLEN